MSPDLASKDEYLDAKLRCAARFVWLCTIDALMGADDFDPSEQWIVGEADQLRALLVAEERPEGRYWELRWHVLGLLGVRQSYAVSSRRVERSQEPESEPAPEPEPEAVAAALNPIRDWVLGRGGRGAE